MYTHIGYDCCTHATCVNWVMHCMWHRTPVYMAPELVISKGRRGAGYNGRSVDVYVMPHMCHMPSTHAS